jgi:hypothetical protein
LNSHKTNHKLHEPSVYTSTDIQPALTVASVCFKAIKEGQESYHDAVEGCDNSRQARYYKNRSFNDHDIQIISFLSLETLLKLMENAVRNADECGNP